MSRLVLVLGGLLAGTGLAEVCARLFMPAFALPALVQRFEMGDQSDRRFKPSSTLGWERVPGPGTKLDRHGFLSLHPAGGRREPGELRVLVIGDSLVEGLFTSPRDLQAWESRLSEAWRRKVKVWSFGVGGYALTHYARVLQFKGDLVGPDVVLMSFCLNDTVYDARVILKQDGRLYMLRGSDFSETVAVSPWLLARSQLYRALWLAYNARAARREMSRHDPGIMSHHFDRVLEWSRRRGASVYAVVWPYFKPSGAYTRLDRDSERAIVGWLERSRTPRLDLGRALPPNFWRTYHQDLRPWDDIHPNAAGNDKARDLMLDFLARRGDYEASSLSSISR